MAKETIDKFNNNKIKNSSWQTYQEQSQNTNDKSIEKVLETHITDKGIIFFIMTLGKKSVTPRNQ